MKAVMGFLLGMIPTGKCRSFLDVGSGRGAFPFPLFRDFPTLEVTSIDQNELQHHISAISFHVMANDDKMMLTVTPIMDNMNEIIIPDFDINMTIDIRRNEDSLTDDGHIRQLADHVLEEYRRATP